MECSFQPGPTPLLISSLMRVAGVQSSIISEGCQLRLSRNLIVVRHRDTRQSGHEQLLATPAYRPGASESSILTKLQVADRAQAIVRAREAGLGKNNKARDSI
jgi:hypothetical protein